MNLTEMWLSGTGFLLAVLLLIFIAFYLFKLLLVKKGKQFFAFLISVWHSVRQATADNPDVQKLVSRHPLFFQFIKRRLDRSNFSGLPLTLLVFAFVYVLSLFGGIVEGIITSDPIVAVDISIANLLAAFRSAELTKVFLGITSLGEWQIILVFGTAAIGVLWLWRKRLYIMPFLLTVIGSALFTQLGKIAFHRPRPKVALYLEHSFSFPSGHATVAVAFYGFLTYMLLQKTKPWKQKVNILFMGALIILLIGFSRLYLGVHYVSDVWGGYLIGALWLIIGISIAGWLQARKKNPVAFALPAKAGVISTALILASLLFYAGFAGAYNPPLSQTPTSRKETVVQNVKDIFSNNQLKYTETLAGGKEEPLSFIIVARNDEQLIEFFHQAGWLLADKVSAYSVTKIAKAVLLKQAYPTAPMTPSFWNLQVHDFGFEKATDANNARQRHHARFWRTNYITPSGKHIYVGTASFDSGIKWGIVHRINPDIDAEREFLYEDLRETKLIVQSKKEQFVEPVLGENFFGDPFFTDGKVYIIKL
jgi:undecaprenyl-diphosphatase